MGLLYPNQYEQRLRQLSPALDRCSVYIDEDQVQRNLIHVAGYYGRNFPRESPLFCYPYGSSDTHACCTSVEELVDHLPVYLRVNNVDEVRRRLWVLTTLHYNPISKSALRNFLNREDDISAEWHGCSEPEYFQWIPDRDLMNRYLTSFRLFSLRSNFAAALHKYLQSACSDNLE